jgi:hypothetical protein
MGKTLKITAPQDIELTNAGFLAWIDEANQALLQNEIDRLQALITLRDNPNA